MQEQLKKFTKDKKTQIFSDKTFENESLEETLLSLKISGRPFMKKTISTEGKSFLTINVFPNNIFWTYKILENGKFLILNSASSGKYKIEISKKTLKRKLKYILIAFLEELKTKKINLKNCIIKLVSPIRIRKLIILLLLEEIKDKNFVIETEPKKVFNGCRARKKRRYKKKKPLLLK